MTLRSQVLSGLFWTSGVRLLSQALNWAITIVVIRLLTPADYGLLAMASVFMNFLVLMAEAGLGAALVQSAQIDETKLRRIFGTIILIDVALCLIQFMAAPLVASFFSEERLVPITQVLAIQYLIMIFSVIPNALLVRQLSFKWQSLTALAGSICGALTTLSMALLEFGVWSLVVGNLVSAAVSGIALNIVAPFIKWPEFSFGSMRALITYGGQVTASRMLWFAYSQADIIVAGKLLGKDLLGIYSVSMHLASLPMQKISSIVNQVAFPAFASVQSQTDKAASHLLKAIRIICLATFPVFWGISSVSTELVAVLLGPKWDQAALPLLVLALVMPVRLISGLIQTAVDGLGRPDIGLKNLLLAFSLMLPAILIGCRWGVFGLSLAWAGVAPLVFLLTLRRSLVVVNLRMPEVLKPMSRSALPAAMMYGCVVLARTYLLVDQPALEQLLMLVAVGVITYAFGSVLINAKVYKEILDLRKK